MLEALLEPVQADEDDHGVNEYRSAAACEDHDDDLLVKVQLVDIDTILCQCTVG